MDESENDTETKNDRLGTVRRRTYLGTVAGSLAVPTVAALASDAKGGTDETHSKTNRVENLIARMTLDEKIGMVHGTGNYEKATGYIPPISRLGIPDLKMADGPVGVRRGDSTAFPATIAAASTWDTDLIHAEGVAMGSEAKAKERDALLAPAMDIDRVPVNGRTFEYYSEDPYLSSRMAVANTTGIQSKGIIATPKHYVANSQETNRTTIDERISQRALREIYLQSFKAAVQEGDAGAVMAAYNEVNGQYMSENDHLLVDVLKDEFGFDGYVVSDWGATHSTVDAAKNGLDVEMPSGTYFGDDLKKAVQDGTVSEDTLDDKVRRVLREMDRFGVLDGDKPGGPGAANTDAHQTIARRIAEEGTVLLKNDEENLPLDVECGDSIAVIGPEADQAHVGGGGSSDVQPPYSVSPLQGVRDRVPEGVSVEYSPGRRVEYDTVPSSALTPPDATDGQHGLEGQYFDNTDFSGDPVLTRVDERVDFTDSDVSKIDGLDATNYSVRWTGTFTVPKAGTYDLALTSDDGSHLYLDGEEVIDNGGPHGPKTKTTTVSLDEGESTEVRIDWYQAAGGATVTFGWKKPQEESALDKAIEAASAADVALVFADGSSTEGADRDDLVLNHDQNDLVSAIVDANENTTVVLRTGGPIVMPWVDSVPSILEMWYPGLEDGNATAALLFGDANPSGKLPITFGQEWNDYPANTTGEFPGEDGEVHYDEGVFVGYRHFDEQDIEPLFAFGHGESYTTFEYDDLRVEPKRFQPNGTLTASARVKNTGEREGSEVVQLYVGDTASSVARPPKELKAFEKVALESGEETKVTFKLDRSALSFWHPDAENWVVENGEFSVMVGRSSRDLPLTATVQVHGASEQ